ncbi:MAG: hypothetical protein NXH91_17215 [Phyllobacteriaceae bacterium]|jgi:hypothetical protein|nr:hypothetical protein [Phyllobacteriaceae bacterium]
MNRLFNVVAKNAVQFGAVGAIGLPLIHIMNGQDSLLQVSFDIAAFTVAGTAIMSVVDIALRND